MTCTSPMGTLPPLVVSKTCTSTRLALRCPSFSTVIETVTSSPATGAAGLKRTLLSVKTKLGAGGGAIVMVASA